jgi:TolB-like protein/Tfp pilus assembly protein PilF
VFKTMGDAFCAAFATATDAIDAALSAQQALHAEPWPERAKIRARMALHTGAADLRGGDYFGTPLNVVARLLAVGHGGQTLVSEITRDLCRDRLPAGTSLKSLGQHSFKGLVRRETVFQLSHPELPQAFPPLKTMLAPIDANVPSIAVLPFVNLSRDEENEYFADGLAEELLNVLSKIRGLRVASRTSAFSFKGAKVDIPTVAQKLNVAAILEGSVRKAGNRVRITAQLVQVATDSHLWSETYDRELEDIFAVQDDIAQSVVKELRSMLLGEMASPSAGAAATADVQAAAKGRSENAEAYRLHMQGRFFEERSTREDTEKAIGYYREALELDPQYALAWAGLSRAYANQAGYSWVTDTADGFERSRQTAERALQLEPDLAEAHASLGMVQTLYDWDWAGAEASLHRALELAPADVRVIRGAALLAGSVGHLDEAIALLRRAVTLDPLSVLMHRSLAVAYLCAGRADEAAAVAEKAVELNAMGALTHYWLAMARLAQRRLEEALEVNQGEPHEPLRLLGVVVLQHARGRHAESDAALRELIKRYATAGSDLQIAQAYGYRGEVDPAFEWLERAYAQRDAGLWMTKVNPLLQNLRTDPRWQSFLEKLRVAG